MPKIPQNSPKRILLKKSLLQGKTAKQAAIDAGLTPASAHNATQKTVVKECQAEIVRDIKAETTVERVLEDLASLQAAAERDGDHSAAIRAAELRGKWLAMFTEKHVVDDGKFNNINDLSEHNRIQNLTPEYSES